MDDIVLKTDLFGDLFPVLPVVEIDYPTAFICRGTNRDLYLLNEYPSQDALTRWLLVKTDVATMVRMNKGELSFQGALKLGGARESFYICSTDDGKYCRIETVNEPPEGAITPSDTFLKDFYPDRHGAGLSAFLYNELAITFVVKQEEVCEDTMSVAAIKSLLAAWNNLKKALKIFIKPQSERFSLRTTGSLVATISFDPPDGNLVQDVDDLSVLKDGLNTILNKQSPEEISAGLMHDHGQIDKASAFLRELPIKSLENGGEIILSRPENEPVCYEISSASIETSKRNISAALDFSEQGKEETSIELTGTFSGLFLEGNKHFVFKSNKTAAFESTVYKGIVDSELANSMRRRGVVLSTTNYKIRLRDVSVGNSADIKNHSYTMVDAQEMPSFQDELFADHSE